MRLCRGGWRRLHSPHAWQTCRTLRLCWGSLSASYNPEPVCATVATVLQDPWLGRPGCRVCPPASRSTGRMSYGGCRMFLTGGQVERTRVTEVHYITPIANLSSILKRGILRHKRAEAIGHLSIA